MIPSVSAEWTIILGMGTTGVACARFLHNSGQSVHIMDNRTHPPGLDVLRAELPDVPFTTGYFDTQLLLQAKEIIISPGLPMSLPALQPALQQGIPVISEIELFARHVTAPVIAITGSNGKSTVTSLVGEMATAAGWQVQVGGNLGTPALDLLNASVADMYVLELSSFQLEATYSLQPQAAAVLNISEDHLDRYTSLDTYQAAKQRIYQGDGVMVINADDERVVSMRDAARKTLTFSLIDTQCDFCIAVLKHKPMLCRTVGTQQVPLLALDELSPALIPVNALAALALGDAIAVPLAAMLDTLRTFRGLPHRCERVATIQGVEWINDSKGTNVGATLAAIHGLQRPKRIILIAGGIGKGADFSPLAEYAAQHLKAVILLGRDAPLLADVLKPHVPLHHSDSLPAAVQCAARLAQMGDCVLLSPACASQDMFENYMQRGQVFTDAILQLASPAGQIASH